MEDLNNAITNKSEEDLINVICTKSFSQRVKLSKDYEANYGKKLEDALKDAFKSDFEDTVVALFTDPIEFDCKCLYDSIHGIIRGDLEDTINEIIASRSNGRMKKILAKYPEVSEGKDLVQEISDKYKNSYGKLLVALIQNERGKGTPDQQACDDCAQKFKECVDSKKENDDLLNEIFVQKSPKELVAISRSYHKLTGKLITKGFDAFTNNVVALLNTLLFVKVSPSEYFASKVNKAIKGAGTNDTMLIRVLVTRAEIDIKRMAKFYEKVYGETMEEAVKGDTSGSYQKILLKLINK